MNSFEANKIFGALLGTVFVLFGGSLLAEGIFHAEAPEQPGFAIAVPDAPAGGGAAPAANEVTPVGQLMQTANAEAGAAIFKRCQACHSGEKGGPNKVGPDLWDVVNRPIASHEGFAYSAAMTEFSQGKTVVWDWDHLNHFLHGPKQYIKGTAMGFAGLPKDQERADLLAYLRSLSDNPPALPAADAGATEAAAGEASAAEGAAAPAGDASAAPTTAPATSTNPMIVPGDAVSQPQSGGTTDQTTGAAPTAPPSGSTPATGGNATSAPAAAPTPPAAPGETAPAAPAQPAPAAQPAPDAPAAPAPAGSGAVTSRFTIEKAGPSRPAFFVAAARPPKAGRRVDSAAYEITLSSLRGLGPTPATKLGRSAETRPREPFPSPDLEIDLPFRLRAVSTALALTVLQIGATGSAGAQETAPPAAAAARQPAAAAMSEWMTSSSLIRPSKYGADFQHYDHVNPQAPKGGRLNQQAAGTFDSFNPFPIRGTPAAGFAAFGGGIAYDTLMDQALDEPGVSHVLIAEALRYPADFSSVSFRLDPRAKFQDGQPITAEDVVWTFQTVTRLSPLYANYYRNVTAAEITGEREVTFRFDQTGNRELPNIMGDLVVLPKHYWEGTDAQGRKRDIDNPTLEIPVGSGPYRVKAYQPGATVTWERVPDYWAANKAPRIGRYNYDQIRYTYFRDQNAGWEAFKRGGFSDYRAENSAGRWATGYDFPAFNDGRVKKEAIPSETGEPMQGFVLNTRRDKFADPRVRRALTLAFNFEEMNRTLFYGLYRRTTSYFQGTELAASGLPSPAELALLEPLRGEVPPEVFTTPFALPDYSAPNADRTYLREAFELLKAAGWERRGTQLVNAATGQPFAIEFLAADPSSSRVIDPFANQLNRLGIQTSTRIVDASQYQALTDNFEFDVITDVFAQSLSPGNEQRDFWSSAAAAQPGSRNAPGIRNKAVDALVDKIIYAPDRDSLVTATHALDRVLLWNFYVVPQWHNPEIWLAHWDKFGMPDKRPAYAGIDPFSWWVKGEVPVNTPADQTAAEKSESAPAIPPAKP